MCDVPNGGGGGGGCFQGNEHVTFLVDIIDIVGFPANVRKGEEYFE